MYILEIIRISITEIANQNKNKRIKYRQKIEQIDLSNEIASIETQMAEIG